MTLGDASEAAAAAAAVAACGSIVDLHLKTQNWSFIGNLAVRWQQPFLLRFYEPHSEAICSLIQQAFDSVENSQLSFIYDVHGTFSVCLDLRMRLIMSVLTKRKSRTFFLTMKLASCKYFRSLI